MINLGGAVFTTVILLGSSTLLHVQFGNTSPEPFVVITHVLPALFGFACVFGIFLVSILFLFQYRLLKRKKLPDLSLQTAPGLARLESAHNLMTAFGVASFTLAILIGALVLPPSGRTLSWWFDTSIMSTALAWIMLLVLLQLRYVAAPMRYLALVTVIGSGVLTLTVFGIGLLRDDASSAHIVCLGCEKS
jgi:HemX protein